MPVRTLASALVTDEMQTVILRNFSFVRLDWLRWVTETLGDSAGNATYTLRKTQLDEFGNPIGAPEMVEPTDTESRIEVTLSPRTNEYFVQIVQALATGGAEDPDRAIYELEACVPDPDGSETCYKSNITVYAVVIERPPLGNLTLVCQSKQKYKNNDIYSA